MDGMIVYALDTMTGRGLKRGVNGKLFRDVIRTLFDNGHVVMGKESTIANRERPYVEIV